MRPSYDLLKLPSSRREFSEFPAFYQDEIAPYLHSLEGERKKSIIHVLSLGGGLALLSGGVLMFGPFGRANFHIAFAIGVIALVLGAWLLNRTRKKINDGLMGRICTKLGYDYTAHMERPAYLEKFTAYKLLPSFNRESWEDEVVGVYKDVAFRLCEADLKYKTSGKNSSTRTVFHGQLIMIDYPGQFLGETVIMRDKGLLNRLGKPGKRFSHVGLASPAFEKAFEAWSTDQVEARDLLDPLVLERFQELDRMFTNAKLRAAFTKGELIIAIETGDKLNMGSMFEPLAKPDRVAAILKEFDVIFDLIDVATKNIDRPLQGQFSVTDVRE